MARRFRSPYRPLLAFAVVVLLFVPRVWSYRSILERDIWVRFDGEGLLVHDRFTPGFEAPQRLSVRDPLDLQSAADFRQQAVITSIEPGEKGFPVGGTPTIYLQSRVPRALWYDLPVSPTGGELSEGVVHIRTAPGWKVLATTGGGKAYGSWLHEWTLEEVLAVLVLSATLSFVFGWKAGILSLLGLAMAGASELHPGWLLGTSLLSFLWKTRNQVRPSWRSGIQWMFLALLAAVGYWTVSYAIGQASEIADPLAHLDRLPTSGTSSACWDEWKDRPSENRLDTLVQESWFNQLTTKGGIIGGLLPDGAGPEEGYRDREAWIPDEDSSFHRIAPPSMEDPIWSPIMACRTWDEEEIVPAENGDSPHPRNPVRPGAVAGQRMVLVLLSPLPAALWRILSIVFLATAIALCLQRAFDNSLRPPAGRGAIPPGFAFLLFLAATSGEVRAVGLEPQGEIEREFRFSREWNSRTLIREISTEDSVLRIPLVPGEVPLDPVEVREGMVVVIRRKVGTRQESTGRTQAGFRRDSLRSGEWTGVCSGSWNRCGSAPIGWTSRIEVDTILRLRVDSTSAWMESWRFFSSNRWNLRFEGKSLEEPWESAWGRSMVILPGGGDSVTIHFQKAKPTPFEPLLIRQVRWEFRDPHLTRSVVHLRFHAAGTDTIHVDLPEGAMEASCPEIDQVCLFPERTPGRVSIPVVHGVGHAEIQWTMPSGNRAFRRVPLLSVSASGVNGSLKVPLEEGAWVPFLRGFGAGPSEAGWRGLAGFGSLCLLAMLRLRLQRAWLDFLLVWLGASLVDPWLLLALVPVVMIRNSSEDKFWRWVAVPGTARRIPVGMVAGFVVVVLAAWILTRWGSPPIPPRLEWYTDWVGPDFPRPWMVVLPGWAWNFAVLVVVAWLLWLGVRSVGPSERGQPHKWKAKGRLGSGIGA